MSLNHSITRRSIFKGAGGIAAASFLGAGAVLGGSASPAHAASAGAEAGNYIAEHAGATDKIYRHIFG